VCCNVLRQGIETSSEKRAIGQCATVYCSVLRYVAVCCGVLRRVAVQRNLLTRARHSAHVAVCSEVLQCVAVCCCVLLRVAARPPDNSTQRGTHCNVLQCVAVCCGHTAACCGVLQFVAVCCSNTSGQDHDTGHILQCVACCSVLHVAVCCSVLQCAAGIPPDKIML